MSRYAVAILAFLFSGSSMAFAQAIRVADLRCEYLKDPLGIDEGHPRLSWVIESAERGQRQTAYQVVVASSRDGLASERADLWDSGKIASAETAQVVYGGKPLVSRQICHWKVRAWDRDGQPSAWSEPASWEMGLLKPTDWSAKWIEAKLHQDAKAEPVPVLRKTFALTKKVASARLYVTALGLYKLFINDHAFGDHVLAPDWTDYRKRVRYQVYDVTALVQRGDNAIVAGLASGWYCGHIGNGGFHYFGTTPSLLAQLEVTYTDGSMARIVSDGRWRIHDSPVVSSDFFLGESYDATKLAGVFGVLGSAKPGFDDLSWPFATVRAAPPINLEGQIMPPVRRTGTVKPISLNEPKPGRWTFDLGQNIVGVARLTLTAPKGTKITLRHAEMLNPDGTIYTRNLRGAPSIDTYICDGNGEESWQPLFTFHGFRYVEVTGLPKKPDLYTITGIVIGSDTPRVGEFSCSDPRINQLQSNIQWGQRGNYLSIPTDCPQRDERLGWMGDAQVFIRTATMNADVAAFFTKWLVDVDDGQSPDGAFGDVSPNTMGGKGTPAWADAGVICPWTIYQVYGDRRILERHLPAMTRWIEWCRTHSKGLIRERDRGGDYGDWLAIGANTPKDLIGTAYFAYSTDLVARSYRAVGNEKEAAKYEQLFRDIKAAFIKRYVKPDGRIHGDTQCCYAMALKFNLLPDELRSKATQYLADDIRAKGWHVSTGFVGVSYLLPVLTEAGKLDTAYRLLMQDTFPSWLFSVKHGATTIWERWDGWTPEKGFQDPGMNSFNHYALGSCGQWLFDTVAGIGLDPDQPGYKHVIIHPRVGGGLTWARASLGSIRGSIASSWSLKDGVLAMEVTIPANTTATVYMPAARADAVRESGKPAAEAEGVKLLRFARGETVFDVQSGTYRFTSR
jgi:alpha-L-rhamnosidase